MEKSVGRIVQVKGLSVKAKLDSLFPPYIVHQGIHEVAPKINGYVKTRVGLETIICQVIGEYSEEINGKINGHFLELQVRGNITKGKFIQGLRMLPIVSAEIEVLTGSEYNLLYNEKTSDTIKIGIDLYDDNKSINILLNKLIPSHIGIFGNTGSGKSNTLTKTLHEYANILKDRKTDRGKFLVFDLNNEYGNDSIVSEDDKTIYKLTTRKDSEKKIPMSLEKLSEDDFIILMNASEKTQVPVIKNAYRHAFANEESDSFYRTDAYYTNVIKSMIKNSQKSLFQSLRHHLSKYTSNLDGFKYHSHPDQKCYYYVEQSTGRRIYNDAPEFQQQLDSISIEIPTDMLDRFLFEIYFSIALENENGVQLDFMMPLANRAGKLIVDLKKVFDFSKPNEDDGMNNKDRLFNDKNICIIQLGNVNKDMKEIIPSIISNNIFNTLADRKDIKGTVVQVINIVIDEAHNILFEGSNNEKIHNNVLEVFEKIVKEGRKFGCFLMLSSQRPSDISQTIMSQLHNYFIHKLVNPNDLQKIRKTVAYLDENSMDFLTVLAPGECIVSGTAFQMPAFIYVEQVQENSRPNSENVILTGSKGLFELQSNQVDDEMF